MADRSVGDHFSCSLSAVVIARVQEFGGDVAVESLLRRAGNARGREYLCGVANWIAYGEAIALLRAGAMVTHHPAFARAVGEDSGRRLGASPLAARLRSLGSPEAVYGTIAAIEQEYSTMSTLEAVDCGPGHAVIVARQIDDVGRSAEHCAWTQGLLATVPSLFGLDIALVEHDTCAAYGAGACHYRVGWSSGGAEERSRSPEQVDVLRDQLDAMHALLELARVLADAGTSSEIARRLAESVPIVVDCDQVAVYVWDEANTELVRAAVTEHLDGPPPAVELARWPARPGTTLADLIVNPRSEPIFIDAVTGDPGHREALRHLGFQATILVPLVSADELLGMLAVAVRDRPERLAPTPDLLDRLSGVGAQAGTALGNGRLVDVITHQALHDQLTGLANRGRFTAELRAVVAQAHEAKRLAGLFYLDLDQFKPINDELGHEAGDELLVAVAERLRSCTRAEDVIARLGGDEFAVLVSGVTEDDINGVAQRLASGFEEPFEVAGIRVPVSASIGRSTYPADAPDADGLLRRADEAMFAHKRGRTGARRSARSGAGPILA